MVQGATHTGSQRFIFKPPLSHECHTWTGGSSGPELSISVNYGYVYNQLICCLALSDVVGHVGEGVDWRGAVRGGAMGDTRTGSERVSFKTPLSREYHKWAGGSSEPELSISCKYGNVYGP